MHNIFLLHYSEYWDSFWWKNSRPLKPNFNNCKSRYDQDNLFHLKAPFEIFIKCEGRAALSGDRGWRETNAIASREGQSSSNESGFRKPRCSCVCIWRHDNFLASHAPQCVDSVWNRRVHFIEKSPFLQAREWASEWANEWAQQREQCGTSEWKSGASDQANRRASGPVLYASIPQTFGSPGLEPSKDRPCPWGWDEEQESVPSDCRLSPVLDH